MNDCASKRRGDDCVETCVGADPRCVPTRDGFCNAHGRDTWCEQKQPCTGKRVGDDCIETCAGAHPECVPTDNGFYNTNGRDTWCERKQPCTGKRPNDNCVETCEGADERCIPTDDGFCICSLPPRLHSPPRLLPSSPLSLSAFRPLAPSAPLPLCPTIHLRQATPTAATRGARSSSPASASAPATTVSRLAPATLLAVTVACPPTTASVSTAAARSPILSLSSRLRAITLAHAHLPKSVYPFLHPSTPGNTNGRDTWCEIKQPCFGKRTGDDCVETCAHDPTGQCMPAPDGFCEWSLHRSNSQYQQLTND